MTISGRVPPRTALLALGSILAATALTGASGAGAAGVVPPPPLATANVRYVASIPLDVPAVSARVVTRPDLGGKRYFYVFGAYGVTIYDIANPELPTPVGRLAFASSENEDFKVSADGKRAIISADGALPFSPNLVTTGVHVVDMTDVTAPKIIGSTSPLVMGTGTGRGPSEHTVVCAEPTCSIIYGSTSGNIYDATNPASIKVVGSWTADKSGKAVSSRHALHRDASGLIITDSRPRLILDPIGAVVPGATPAKPALVSQGQPNAKDSALQHNNIRPDAQAWTARSASDPVVRVPVTADARAVSLTPTRPVMRPGELLIGESESNTNQNCASAGALSTWSMADFDKGAAPEQLEMFAPLRGTYTDDGNPPANFGGCSGHWFEERDGIIAASWYEHGTRFLSVDKTTGSLRGARLLPAGRRDRQRDLLGRRHPRLHHRQPPGLLHPRVRQEGGAGRAAGARRLLAGAGARVGRAVRGPGADLVHEGCGAGLTDRRTVRSCR